MPREGSKPFTSTINRLVVLDLAKHWPGEAMPTGCDVVEWLEQHDRAGSRLAQLAKDAPLWEAHADEGTRTREDSGGGADEDIDEVGGGRPKQADVLIEIAQRATLFHDEEGTAYADFGSGTATTSSISISVMASGARLRSTPPAGG
jgi:hypothetical protein